MKQSISKRINIGITAGDPCGIGPEIILKALAKIDVKDVHFFIIGDYSVFKRVKDRLKYRNIKTPHFTIIRSLDNLSKISKRISLIDLDIITKRKFCMGKAHKVCGYASVEYIKESVNLAKKGIINALVTAPINKKSIHLAGYKWPGHTELMAELTKTKKYAMMFIAGHIKVVLVTTHLPIKEVSNGLRSQDIYEKIRLSHMYLKRYFNIKKPLIGICGLNPHASDGGVFGDEEEKIILPAARKARKDKINVVGPESAESLFYKMYHKEIDIVICMYHDQGLVPIKMILRDKAVNLTLGLPFIRTSPSSGTAYDISPKFIASEASMMEAIKLAIRLSRVKSG